MTPGALLAAFMIGIGVAPHGVAQRADAPPEHAGQSESSIDYRSGGIGEEEQQAMAALRDGYNLRLTFATQGSGQYRADVCLLILDVAGKQVLHFDAVGPLFYARLVPGRYRIWASANGKVLSQSAVLARSGARELYFYWNQE